MKIIQKILSFFGSKNRYEKITESEVDAAIYDLQKRSLKLEEEMVEKQGEIAACKQKYKESGTREMRNFYAKKASLMMQETEQKTQQAMFLMYNSMLLGKLKASIIDKDFYSNSAKGSLNSLLGDQKGLANFLNDVLETKVTAENQLTSADDTFKLVMESYSPNKEIYGMGEQENELAAQWEEEEGLDFEMGFVPQEADETDIELSVKETNK